MVLDIIPGGSHPVHGQSFDPAIHQTHGDVPYGIRVVGHDFPDRAVGILYQGLRGDFRLFPHDQLFEGVSGAGTFFPGNDVDGMGLELKGFPIGNFPLEDLANLPQAEVSQGVLFMHDDGDAVISDGKFLQALFLLHQFPGGSPQIGGALLSGIDPCTGPTALDVDASLGVLTHILFG
ncbi:MAG: hypothetical protein P8X58_07160 [Syntrophobacterales bacterium]